MTAGSPWMVAGVFVGGGTGAVLRFLVGAAVPAPWGTLTVNVVGSALLGFVAHPASGLSESTRLVVGTGLLGGLTTYSSFNLDLVRAAMSGRWRTVLGLAAATVLSCGVAGVAGWWVAQMRAG